MLIDRGLRNGLFSLVVAGGVVAAGCGPSSQASEVAEGEGEFVKVVNVEVATLEPTEFTAYVRILGEVEAMNDITISAEESGVIERFYIEKGEPVRKGQPIAKIDDRVLRAQVEEADAAARLAAWRFDRQKQLWEEEQIGSELAYQEAKHAAQLQAARLKNLQARLDRTVLAAPITGIFDQRYVDAGERVDPGTQVARFVEVDRLKVVGGVPERFAPEVQRGDRAVITFDVLPDSSFEGDIGYVGSAIDTRNRTFPIEIVMDNPDQLLKPQMIAGVEIATERLEEALVVPQTSVLRTEDGYQVFIVVEEDGDLFARPRGVTLGPSYADLTVLESGIEAGERVIVRGQQLVEAGDRVRVVNQSAVAAEER